MTESPERKAVSPTRLRREREKEQRRRSILDAAERVFAEKPFHAASLDEVAELAEYAKGTIYLYFKNKEALYSALFEEKVERMFVTVRADVDAAKTHSDKLAALVASQLRYAEENAWFFRIFTQERMDVGDDLKRENWSRVYSLYYEFLAYMGATIAAAQKGKVLRKGDPAQFSLMLLGVVNIAIRSWLEHASSDSLVSQSDFILDFFLHGVAAPSK